MSHNSNASAALLVGLLVGLGTPGCGKKQGPDCAQASAHFMSILESELAKTSDADRLKSAQTNLPTLQSSLLKACEEKKWDLTIRKCIFNAKSPGQVTACAPVSAASGTAEKP